MHSKLKADAVLVSRGYTSEKWVMHSKLKENKIMNIKIYTDGACSSNPGPGGWGCVLQAVLPNGQLYKVKMMGTVNE